MNIRTAASLLVAVVGVPAAFLCAGCPSEDLTSEEAQEAVEEVSLASQASSVAEGSIELTTSFTLGAGVDAAAEEIREFVVSQLACAEVEREGATVTIQYGATGSCLWHGQTYTGTHAVTVTRSEENDVLVHHEWTELSNGRVSVDGSADVTWDLDAKTRRVVHELTWTRLRDNRQGTGSGDRLQSPLDGDWTSGIVIDGERAWQGARGNWTLDIEQVEWQWVDPLPQSGTYTAITPAGKEVSMSFSRTGDHTIHVTVDGARRDFEFDVTSLGEVE